MKTSTFILQPLIAILTMTGFQTLAFASPDSELISISAVGDIMLGTNFPNNYLPADQAKASFTDATPYFKSSDIRFGNFEGTLFGGPTQADGKAGGANRFLFRTPIDYVGRLTDSGFNVLSLANNHAHDFGAAGIRSSKQTLSLAGIQYSSKDGEVARFNVRGHSIALIADDFYSGRRSVVTPESTYQEIAQLKSTGNLVIVSAHVGGEGSGVLHVRPGSEIFMGEKRGDSIQFAHQAIDQGADLILMHGPHVPRAMEIYRGHLIVYSLGNFATGQGIDITGVAGLAPLVQIQIDGLGKFVRGHLESFQQIRPQGTYVDARKGALHLIRALSEKDFPQSSPQFSESGLITP